MAKYTQLNQKQIVQLARQYGISVESARPMEGGAANSSYLIHAGQRKYVLTVYEDKTIPQVVEMGQLLRELEKYSFPTVVALQTTSGDLVAEHEGKPVLVKEYIHGQVIKNMEEDMLAQVGNALARLHQIPAPDNLRREHPYGLETFSTFIGLDIDAKFDAWLSDRMIYLNENTPDDLPRALIHGDMFYDNVLFDDRKLKAIIDFEEVCTYYRIFDLGMALLGICALDGKLDLVKGRALISGYLGRSNLEESEKDVLQLMTETAAVATSCWRFWKYNVHDLTPERAQKHWDMARIANHIHDIPKDQFTAAVFGNRAGKDS